MFAPTPTKRVLFPYWVKPVLLGVAFVSMLLLGLMASVFYPAHTDAAAQSTISFQARLQTASGAIVPDGYYNVQFKLYDDATAGTNPWMETYYDSNGASAGNDNRVRVQNGYLSVALGSQTAFPTTINWDQQMYLTMNIGGTTQTATPTYDGEMNPRLALTAVPYAFRAGQLAKQTGTYNSTLGFATQTGSNSILLPDESGTVCLRNSTACGFLTGSAANGSYVQLQNASPGLQQTGHLNISGNGIFGGSVTAAGDITSTTGVLSMQGTGNSYFAGNVGIGIASPSSPLQVHTAASGTALTLSNGVSSVGASVGIDFKYNTTQNAARIVATQNVSGGGDLYLQTAAAGNGAYNTRMAVTRTGDVGIGTTSPGALLQVGDNTGTYALINNASGVFDFRYTTNSRLLLSTNAQSTFGLGYAAVNGDAGIRLGSISSYSYIVGGANLLLNPASGNGNVGIGTTSPGYKLDVNGDSNVSGSYHVGGTAGATTTCSGGQFLQNAVVQGGIVTGGACAAAGGGIAVVGTLDSQTKSTDGAVISGTSIYMQTADASKPGLVSTGTQSFAGAKTFSSQLTTSAGITNNNAGITSIGAVTGATTINGTGNVTLQAAGTNTLLLDTAGAGTITVGQNATTLNVGGGTGSETITVGNSTGNDTVNIATGSGTDTINLGTSTANTTTLNLYGNTLVKTPGTNSTTALQVQNAGGSTVLGIDTSNGRILVGGGSTSYFPKLYFGDVGTNNPWIAEYGTGDSDALQVQGRAGLYLSTGSSANPVLTLDGNGNATFQTTNSDPDAFQVLNGSGVPKFVIDTTNSRVYVGNPSGDTSGTLLVLGSKTNSGDPSGVDGAMYYNSSTDKFRCYEDGSWSNCISHAKISSFTQTSYQTVPWGNSTNVRYNSTDSNEANISRNAANDTFTINESGIYQLSASVQYAQGQPGQTIRYLAIINISSSTIYTETTDYPVRTSVLSASTTARLTAGTQLIVDTYQENGSYSGGTPSALATMGVPHFVLTRIGD